MTPYEHQDEGGAFGACPDTPPTGGVESGDEDKYPLTLSGVDRLVRCLLHLELELSESRRRRCAKRQSVGTVTYIKIQEKSDSCLKCSCCCEQMKQLNVS